MGAMDVLLLVGDETVRDFMSGVLHRHRTTICGRPDEARQRLAKRPYDLVVITNGGVSPWEAVAIIPARRRYPVFFLTGHMDPDLEEGCRERDIAWAPIPMPLQELRRELRIALDDLEM